MQLLLTKLFDFEFSWILYFYIQTFSLQAFLILHVFSHNYLHMFYTKTAVHLSLPTVYIYIYIHDIHQLLVWWKSKKLERNGSSLNISTPHEFRLDKPSMNSEYTLWVAL